jgi:hypothetical protein
MTNSVVPMPKAPMASANSAMGTVFLSGNRFLSEAYLCAESI